MSLLTRRGRRGRGLSGRRRAALAIAAALIAMPACLRAADDSSSPATFPATRPVLSTGPTSAPAAHGFDPSRHMHVSEVRAGMKGYGLTVLSGTQIQKFDVEVISVLHDLFGPQQDVVMIRCLDDFMKTTGPIQGCSGSPIYLYGDDGKPRLIGAYAYGFELAKEPIVGVQPIENMLKLPTPDADQVRRAIGGASDAPPKPGAAPMSVSMIDRGWVPMLKRSTGAKPQAALIKPVSAGGERLSSLATPLSISGVSQRVMDQIAPMLADTGFHPMLAMSAHADASGMTATIQPGSVLAAQMLSGDLEMTAVGTCTEVLDGRAYGFGHPFNGEGATSIPMGAGQIHLVMPVLSSSFKLGSIGQVSGSIDMDGAVGVAGNINEPARTIPVTVEVNDLAAGTTRTFHYQAAMHRTYSPDLIATALQASILADHALPLENTIDYSVSMHFPGKRDVTVSEVATSNDGFNVVNESAVPIVAFANNPFESLLVQSVDAKVTIKSGVEQLDILAAAPAKPSYEPGETVRINVRLRDQTGVEQIQPLDVKLPPRIAEGDHVISIVDGPSNLESEAQERPYRFTIRTVDELYNALRSLTTIGRSDAIYARLANGKDGMAIGRTPLPMMPPSRRAILTAAARPDTGEVTESDSVVVPMREAVRGHAEVTIKVAKHLP